MNYNIFMTLNEKNYELNNKLNMHTQLVLYIRKFVIIINL